MLATGIALFGLVFFWWVMRQGPVDSPEIAVADGPAPDNLPLDPDFRMEAEEGGDPADLMTSNTGDPTDE